VNLDQNRKIVNTEIEVVSRNQH